MTSRTTVLRRRSGASWRVPALLSASLLAGAAVVSTQGVVPGQPGWPPRLAAPAPGEIEVLPVQGNVYMLVGAGANITVQAGDEGVLVVDTGVAQMSEAVLAAIRRLSTRPLRYIINTVEYDDHVGGNAAIADAGETIPFRAPDYAAGPQGALDVSKASVIAFLTVFHRLAGASGTPPRIPEEGWPDNTYSIPQKRLYFNGEPIVILHRPANNDGNSVVLFRKSDVVSAGDLLDLTGYPRIDLEAGGGIDRIVESLNGLIDVTVPAANAAGGTLVVPGHGRLADHAEVVYYRDMMTIIRDRVQDMIRRGLTLEQVKAARPTREYDARYGRDTGPWTTERFVEAVYRSLIRS
ncbi:MAG: MBL fold metallo-hydrolase [Acidobacteria bacterium]|nr:MBL fold metallo-hydrolase [Acidobacteriota bacterium]